MNSQDFFNLFNLVDGQDYVKKYIWDSDTSPDIGFAIIKNYPKNKSFIPAKKKNNTDNTVMLIKIYLSREKTSNEIFNVSATVAKVSLFTLDKVTRRIGENWDDPDSPTQESTVISNKSIQPINLEEANLFSLNIKTKQFFRKRKVINGKEIVTYIYEAHIKTYSHVRGFWLKAKMGLHKLLVKIIENTGKGIVFILPYISGRKIENKTYNLLLSPFNFIINPNTVKDDGVVELIEYDNLLKKN